MRIQFLKNPGKYRSVSAFAPIANPAACPWGRKAFSGYFGTDDRGRWVQHDATELVKDWNGDELDILIDVVRPPSSLAAGYVTCFLLLPLLTFTRGGGGGKGTADKFYAQKQLLPENFAKAADGKGKVNVRMQEGYDHSYYFVASFADDHVNHAAKYLRH